MKKIAIRFLPLILGILLAAVAILFGQNQLGAGSVLLYRPLLLLVCGICFLFIFLRRYLEQPVSATMMAREFAILIKKMMDSRFSLGVFVFKDGWWRLMCFVSSPEDENNAEEPEFIGEWTSDETDAMIKNGMDKMFQDGHLDRRCLSNGVKDVYLELVKISEDDPETVAINIVYEKEFAFVNSRDFHSLSHAIRGF